MKSGVSRETAIKQSLVVMGIILLLTILLYNGSQPASAQQGGTYWSPYQRVPGYSDDTDPPYLIADQNRTVHAFTSQWVGEGTRQKAIVYRQWSLDGGWTFPVDVLLSPINEARLTGVTMDEEEQFHLVFWGGDNTAANLYYSSAPAVKAGNTRSWLPPELIGGNASDPPSADITVVGDEILVVYSGYVQGKGLYAIYSHDNGKTWSNPELIYMVDDNTLSPFSLQLLQGGSGSIYLIWTVVDGSGQNLAGYFSRMDLANRVWSAPVNFAESIGVDQGMGIAHPNLIEHDDQLLIMYNNGIPPVGVPPAQYVVTSSDEGRTWSSPQRAFPSHVGRNGVVSLVVDSSDTLHALFAQRIPLSINNSYAERFGVWHSLQDNGAWIEPEEIVATTYQPGQPAAVSSNTYPVGGYDVRAVVSQGNVILATWQEDPGAGDSGVRFSYTVLGTPELPVLTSEAGSVSLADSSLPTETVLGLATIPSNNTGNGSVNLNTSPPPPTNTYSPGSILVVAMVPVVVILAGIFIFRRIFA